jgi:5-methylthioadenosine/S-adenosylhomocysteine deaminase
MDEGIGVPDSLKEPVAAAIASVDELAQEYSDQLESEMFVLMTGPNTPGINATEDACREVAAYARERGLRRSAHVAEYQGVRQRVREVYGIDGVVRWLESIGTLSSDLLAVHSVQVDDEEISMLAARGVSVSHNPFSNLFCGPDIAPIGRMIDGGVRVALGTDGAANNSGQGIFDVMRIARMLERSEYGNMITPMTTLKMATIDAAHALGLGSNVGSIEVGKHADIIIVDLDQPHMAPLLRPISHLGLFTKASDVRTAIVGGRIVMDQRVSTMVSEPDALRQAERAASRVVAALESP